MEMITRYLSFLNSTSRKFTARSSVYAKKGARAAWVRGLRGWLGCARGGRQWLFHDHFNNVNILGTGVGRSRWIYAFRPLVGAALKGTRGAIYWTPPEKHGIMRGAHCALALSYRRATHFPAHAFQKRSIRCNSPSCHPNFHPSGWAFDFEMEWKQPLSSIANVASFHAAFQFFSERAASLLINCGARLKTPESLVNLWEFCIMIFNPQASKHPNVNSI
jgi:hypothetical protein